MLNSPNALDVFAGFFDRAWRLATAPLRTPGRYRGVLISHTPLDKRRIAPLFFTFCRKVTLQIEPDLHLLTVGIKLLRRYADGRPGRHQIFRQARNFALRERGLSAISAEIGR